MVWQHGIHTLHLEKGGLRRTDFHRRLYSGELCASVSSLDGYGWLSRFIVVGSYMDEKLWL